MKNLLPCRKLCANRAGFLVISAKLGLLGLFRRLAGGGFN
jgi:hypothetical protein